jgi:hypothetical protein
MDDSGQLHALAALPLDIHTTGQEAGWAPKPV